VESIGGASDAATDFTALGHDVKIAGHLESEAGPDEVIASDATYKSAQISTQGLEQRDPELKCMH
jgi:class 3 adenylate cyclase